MPPPAFAAAAAAAEAPSATTANPDDESNTAGDADASGETFAIAGPDSDFALTLVADEASDDDDALLAGAVRVGVKLLGIGTVLVGAAGTDAAPAAAVDMDATIALGGTGMDAIEAPGAVVVAATELSAPTELSDVKDDDVGEEDAAAAAPLPPDMGGRDVDTLGTGTILSSDDGRLATDTFGVGTGDTDALLVGFVETADGGSHEHRSTWAVAVRRDRQTLNQWLHRPPAGGCSERRAEVVTAGVTG